MYSENENIEIKNFNNNIQTKEKFLNIDFLRFICILIIFLFHYCAEIAFGKYGKGYSFENFTNDTSSGYIAVYFFFIMSGFFLAYTFNKNLSVIDFIKKKILRLWPCLAFVNILMLISSFFGIIKFKLYANFLSLLFLNCSGIAISTTNITVDWYISVLFWVSLFYFYIFKYFKKEYYNFFIPIIVLLSFTFLVHVTNGGMGGHIEVYYNFINIGLVRGLSSIGLGYIIFNFYEYLKNKPFCDSLNSLITYSIIEGYLLGFVVYESILHKMSFNNKIILVIAFSFLFLSFLLKRGLISRFFDKKVFGALGKYSYALYITHYYFMYNLIHSVWIKHNSDIIKFHPYLFLLIVFIIAMSFAILTYHFVEVPAAKFLKRKFFNN